MALQPEPIIVLGAFRSGTSLIATALNALGVFLGNEADFQPADEFNSEGYWELEAMQNINVAILSLFRMSYFEATTLPPDCLEAPGADHMVRQIRDLLTAQYRGKPTWGWKVPCTSILLPFYREALEQEGVEDPYYIISVRHPLSVAHSEVRRYAKSGFQQPDLSSPNGSPPPVHDRTLGLWLQYTLSALHETRGKNRVVVSHERFLQDPRPYLNRWVADAESLDPTEAQLAAAAATINPELSHSRFSREDLAGLPQIIRDVYELCERADQDPAAFKRGDLDEEIERLWQEWNTLARMSRPFPLPFVGFFLVWQTGRTTTKYEVAGSWQKLKVPVEAPADHVIQVDPYPLPCHIWIRRAVWRVNGKQIRAMFRPGPGGILEDFGGEQRLTVLGPAPLVTRTPSETGPLEFEIEFRIHTGENVLQEILHRLVTRKP